MKLHEFSYPINSPAGHIFRSYDGCMEGTVYTPHGMVAAYSQGDRTGQRKASHFIFVFNGRAYVRQIDGKRYTKRGLATVAGRFAKEIAEE